jgi:hypothetical protein
MEFVDINASRLTGGRRDSGYVSFGTNNTSSNLVPAPELPASAGALGGTDLHSVLKGTRAKKRGGAIILGKDGSYRGVGSDAPRSYARMAGSGAECMESATMQHGENHQLGQFHGGAVRAKKPLGYPSPIVSPGVSRMAVGFGRKPMGADPRTYTPRDLPKSKSVMNAVHLMASGRSHVIKCGGAVSGGDLLGDAWKQLKSLGVDLVKELGPVAWTELKGVMKDELKKGIHSYASSGNAKSGSGRGSPVEPKHLRKHVGAKFLKDFEKELLSGGDFWGDLGGYTKDFALDVGKEILPIVKEEAKSALKDSIRSSIRGSSSAPASGEGRKRGGKKSGLLGSVLGVGKDLVMKEVLPIVKEEGVKMAKDSIRDAIRGKSAPAGAGRKRGCGLFDSIKKQAVSVGKDLLVKEVLPIVKEEGAKMAKDAIKGAISGKKSAAGRKRGGKSSGLLGSVLGVGKDLVMKEVLPIVKEEGVKMAKDSIRDAIRGKSKSAPAGAGRAKKYTARGAIVSEVMKKHGLSLPQASKYVKEHGLY